MVENNHTFDIGETFKGEMDGETYEIVDKIGGVIYYTYNFNGETLGKRTNDRETLQMFVQSGYWKTPMGV